MPRLTLRPRPDAPTRPRAMAVLGALACAAALSLSACSAGSDTALAPTATSAPQTPSTRTTTPAVATTSAKATTTASTTATRTKAAPRPSASRTPTRSPARPSFPRQTATPKPRVTPRPSPSPPSKGGVAAQVISLVNTERAKKGCRAVSANAALTRAAQGHSSDMAAKNYFSHTSKDGRTFADRIRDAGYTGRSIGENIAAGQTTAAAVMSAWMNSSGHRANILNCSYTSIGVGHATGGSYGHYWTQDFGG